MTSKIVDDDVTKVYAMNKFFIAKGIFFDFYKNLIESSGSSIKLGIAACLGTCCCFCVFLKAVKSLGSMLATLSKLFLGAELLFKLVFSSVNAAIDCRLCKSFERTPFKVFKDFEVSFAIQQK